jgi:NAD(P)-dependent dehydrogenase (short-subunit alcohol dehydrogenase family)
MIYGADTTTDDVLADRDLSGLTALVTGASGGIGEETARALAAHGARVTLASRDTAKNAAAAARILAGHPDAEIDTGSLDLASLASVRDFASGWLDGHARLDMLVNNAGVMCTPFGHTADGFETQFGTNHLGHFLLTNLLRPALAAAPAARVVNLSSAGHGFSNVDLGDPNYERRPYDGWQSYGQSKTANILFSVGLAARGVQSFAVHPGGIHTELGRYMTAADLRVLQERIAEQAAANTQGGGFRWKTVPQGAATSVWAATAPELADDSGLYLEDCQRSVPRAEAVHAGFGYEPYAVDPTTAAALWALSEELVGHSFDG